MTILLSSTFYIDANALVEFQQSTTMFIILKHVVKDKIDYKLFSYYGQVVMDI